ncbi:MAG TPA: 3-hydroxyacyl-ACP dehydratase FabZ [Synergistales bacterium]|jgi:3-hydroxyacyl-[acyl-carrier-protein] dehydratase|nr:3-hydroxyacyl-ACP dehydratase FabZ [Synergistales bacterium]
MLDIHKIFGSLPHRYPFLLVDRILEIDSERVIGLKNVTINEPFFQGHFPAEPVMPGVLILEAMGQVAGMLITQRPDMAGVTIYLTSVEKAKLRRPVVPGDQLVTEARIERIRGRVGKVRTVARVGDEVAAEAVLGFILAPRLTGEKAE